MVYFALFLTLMSLAFWVYVLFDVIGSDAERIRLLPKPAWAVIVLLLPKIGALAWFLLGRPPREPTVTGPAGPPSPFPEYDHPNRARAATPQEDEEFLRRCRERAEEQRRRAREQAERRDQDGPEETRD